MTAWKPLVSVMLCVCCAATSAFAEEPAASPADEETPVDSDALSSILERETLTDNWFALGEKLSQHGVTVDLGLTQIYQLNLRGAAATHRRAGRYTGSYDLEVTFDLEKLLRLPGASVFVHAEGGWSDGLDASSIGSVLGGVNADAYGDQVIDVTELYWEQTFLDGRLRFHIGKLDITGGFEHRGCPVSFDCNAYANDEASQFLNAALVNNPTIPFPDCGLGAAVYAEVLPRVYVSAGVADARADPRETGFRTAFHGEDYFVGLFETGITPLIPSPNGGLQGAYRVGMWYQPEPKQRHSGTTKRDDVGFYLSFDQAVFRESAEEDDTQGLGLFLRYGFAHSDQNEIEHFWSVGAQYEGLIPGRDADVLGVGFAQGRLVRDAGYDEDHESVLEIYYSVPVTPWLVLSPSVQYIWNPGGNSGVGDSVVLGLRCQMSF